MALRLQITEKEILLVSENPTTKAAMNLTFTAENVIKLGAGDVLSLFKSLDEKTLEALNKKLKAELGQSVNVAVKDFGADKPEK